VSRKARHRKPYRLLDYPAVWYWREQQNRRWLKKNDRIAGKELRQIKWVAFKQDFREWLNID